MPKPSPRRERARSRKADPGFDAADPRAAMMAYAVALDSVGKFVTLGPALRSFLTQEERDRLLLKHLQICDWLRCWLTDLQLVVNARIPPAMTMLPGMGEVPNPFGPEKPAEPLYYPALVVNAERVRIVQAIASNPALESSIEQTKDALARILEEADRVMQGGGWEETAAVAARPAVPAAPKRKRPPANGGRSFRLQPSHTAWTLLQDGKPVGVVTSLGEAERWRTKGEK